MKSINKRRWAIAIVISAIALAAVLGVIVWRQAEYAKSAAYYDSLRG